jgi:hypothetical protein
MSAFQNRDGMANVEASEAQIDTRCGNAVSSCHTRAFFNTCNAFYQPRMEMRLWGNGERPV